MGTWSPTGRGTTATSCTPTGWCLAASDPTVAVTTSYSGYFRLGYDNFTGWPNAPTSGFFAGSLDEGVAYGRTLTATDAANHYTAATTS